MSVVGKIPSLNGIRALSVLLVVVSHCGFGHVVPGGFGVTVFFMLSGYLITTLFIDELDNSNKIKIPHFYARRAIRLYPAMVITIIVAYFLAYFEFIGGKATIEGAIAQLFYFANYFQLFFDGNTKTPAGTGIFWSLAVEEHFYFLYPLIFSAFLCNLDKKRLVIFLSVLMVIMLAWRIYLVEFINVSEGRIIYASDTRIDSIIIGCILALTKNPMNSLSERKLNPSDILIIISAVACILFTFLYRDETFRLTLRFTLQGGALFILFYYSIAFSQHPIFSFLNTRIMDRIGTYSYTIYLVHYILIEVLKTNFPLINNDLGTLFIVLVVSVLIGYLMYNYVEKPLQIYRKRCR